MGPRSSRGARRNDPRRPREPCQQRPRWSSYGAPILVNGVPKCPKPPCDGAFSGAPMGPRSS
eukprot:6412715-Pyramimonas_sp.AAC.1